MRSPNKQTQRFVNGHGLTTSQHGVRANEVHGPVHEHEPSYVFHKPNVESEARDFVFDSQSLSPLALPGVILRRRHMEHKPNHYQILGLEPKQSDASLTSDEIRVAYKQSLLRHHPDKDANSSGPPNLGRPQRRVAVDDIAVAYKVLSDPKLRAEYDRSLLQQTHSTKSPSHHIGLETIDLDDLSYDSSTGEWTKGCRCGNTKGFVVTETELEENGEDGELITGCKGCSLCLRILFSVDE